MNRATAVESVECCVKPPEKAACSCTYEDLLDAMGKKWAVVLLNLLHRHGRLGYNALLDKMADITPKAFGDKLKLLEERGLIARSATVRPRRVFYELTPAGKMLVERLAPFFNSSGKSAL
jgi:DNA-binding HxlR family transcriptional regulator